MPGPLSLPRWSCCSWLPVLALGLGCSDAAPLDSGAVDKGQGGLDGGADEDDRADVVINELLAGSSVDGADWIELYNRGLGDGELSGWSLGDDPEEGGWTLPEDTVLAAGAHLLVFASDGAGGEPGELHADFKLSSSGETVLLWDGEGEVVDVVELPPLEDDQSYARQPDGGDDWSVEEAPTPGQANR